ncbi:MAG: DUF6491 family protein [Steroidobacteraceae bacterium]
MRSAPGRLALALAVLAGTGCTAGGTAATHAPSAPLPGTEACIFTVNLYDWTVLDDTTLIVYAPVHKEPYLVKLFAPVFDLSFHQTLGFEGVEHNGQLCKGDYVLVRGDLPQRMSIRSIRALTPDQAKQLIADSKQKQAAGAPKQ